MEHEGATVLSVVIPMYNEEEVVPLLVRRLRPVLDGLGEPYEVVAVDDGSVDGTFAELAALLPGWEQLRVLRLRRNGGHQVALLAGLFAAVGEHVVSIDADLQDPPETIPRMLSLARDQGFDVVYGVRGDRSTDTRFKRWTAGAYYRLVRRVLDEQVPAHGGDFRLLSRAVIDVLRQLPERSPVLRLLVPWLGFPSAVVTYAREERAAGHTKYPLRTMVRLGVQSVTSFSAAPLRIAAWLGGAGVALCALLSVLAVVAHLTGSTVPGWSSLYLVVLFLGAVQLLCLGLLGEYIGRSYTAALGRPAYLIGYDSAAGPRPRTVSTVDRPAPR